MVASEMIPRVLSALIALLINHANPDAIAPTPVRKADWTYFNAVRIDTFRKSKVKPLLSTLQISRAVKTTESNADAK